MMISGKTNCCRVVQMWYLVHLVCIVFRSNSNNHHPGLDFKGVKNLQKTTRQCLKYQFCASAGSTSPLISQMSKLSDRLGDQSWVSLWVSCERQIYLSTADPRSVWIVRFPSSERTTEGFRTTHSSPLILCWRCRPQLYPESIHSFSNSFPARCPSPLRQNQGSGGGRRSIICLVQKEEGRLTEVHRLFFPLALARHANEQRHMWLCD